MLKPLKIKRLSDVRKAKACVKLCVKEKIVENQALDEILYAFTHIRPKMSLLTLRPYRLTSQSVGTIFAGKNQTILHISIQA